MGPTRLRSLRPHRPVLLAETLDDLDTVRAHTGHPTIALRGHSYAAHLALPAPRAAASACAQLTVPVPVVDGTHDIRPRRAVDSLVFALPNVQRVPSTPVTSHGSNSP
ncbi:hypothetical protein [Streptomyces tanashiensis]|uniref:Uncharacterized protein n=1 Tax=Streptomyces tanashiensis TaxID=67367 RepID=A0ABY6QNG8_9ACTN|nr:hypothetical protein [Streptomyces tanashiensis]UZX19333.1 hypothetical protein LDH80_00585 [Streptomyces tanashiensis]